MQYVFSFLLLSLTFSCASNNEKGRFPESLDKAIQSDYRTEANVKRDKFRNPKETLEFFGIKPNMKVIEIWPSGGWYTEILAPFLALKGEYIIADPASDPRGYTTKRKEWMKAHPQVASTVKHTVFLPTDTTKLAKDNSVDMILTFRSIHGWKPDSSKQAALEGFFRVLKPGGILGLVAHRAAKGQESDPNSGYLSEESVIQMATQAGFVLDAKSEINANPKDSTQHPHGVWTLPPSLRLGDKDRAKYQTIGESDRMTLKFKKP